MTRCLADLLDAASKVHGVVTVWTDPFDAEWAMTTDAIEFTCALAGMLDARTMIEFGSGASTLALADDFRARGGHIISVDHDPDFHEHSESLLRAESMTETVTSRFAPVVLRPVDGRLQAVYRLDRRWFSAGGADLVLVDGPPDRFGGRSGAIRQAVSLCRSGGVVVVDDLCREAEARAIEELSDAPGIVTTSNLCPQIGRGLAVISVSDPGAPLDLLPPTISQWRSRDPK